MLSIRYPVAEIATALGMVITYLIKVNEPKVDTLQLIYWLIYIAIFVLITVIDMEHKLILFVVVIPSCILAIVDAITTSAPPNLERSLLGGALGFGTFLCCTSVGSLMFISRTKCKGAISVRWRSVTVM